MSGFVWFSAVVSAGGAARHAEQRHARSTAALAASAREWTYYRSRPVGSGVSAVSAGSSLADGLHHHYVTMWRAYNLDDERQFGLIFVIRYARIFW